MRDGKDSDSSAYVAKWMLHRMCQKSSGAFLAGTDLGSMRNKIRELLCMHTMRAERVLSVNDCFALLDADEEVGILRYMRALDFHSLSTL